MKVFCRVIREYNFQEPMDQLVPHYFLELNAVLTLDHQIP